MKRLVFVVLALAMGGCGGHTAAPIPASPPLVEVQPATKTTREGTNRFSATVEADTRLRLIFNSSGYVHEILQMSGKSGVHRVGAGDHVRRGQVLAELRTQEYRARVSSDEANLGQALAGERDSRAAVVQAQAQTRQSRAQVTQMQAAEVQARAQVREAVASLRSAQAQLLDARAQDRKAQADYDRAVHLQQNQSITQPDFDSARVAHESCVQKVKEAQQQVSQLEAKVTEAKANVLASSGRVVQAKGQVDASVAQEERALAGVQSAEAKTQGMRSNIELSKVALEDVYLKAPMDGVVLSRSVEVGAQVSAGAVGFEMADTRSVRVTFGVTDILVSALKRGQNLRLTCGALPGRSFEGSVSTIAADADTQSRVYKVEVKVPNPHDLLKVGMIATLDLAGKESGPRHVIVVPLGALLPSKNVANGYRVFVVEGGKAVSREVKVGQPVGDHMDIVEGLKEGESVVVEGANLINDGQTVKVKS